MKSTLNSRSASMLARACALCLCLSFLQPSSAAEGDLDKTFSGDGKLVASFGGKDDAYGSVRQPDGKLVVVGSSEGKVLLLRYTAAGMLDATFDTDGIVKTTVGADAYAVAVHYLPGGQLLVGGASDGSFIVLRYNANGSRDMSFGTGGAATATFGGSLDYVSDMAVAPSGKIILVGMTNAGANRDFALACFNADGSPDGDFDGDGRLTVDIGTGDNALSGVVVQPNGNIVASGYSLNGTDSDFTVVRYLPTGATDNSFGTAGVVRTEMGGDDYGNALCRDGNGNIVVVGSSSRGLSPDPVVYHAAVARYSGVDGSPDTTFSGDGEEVYTTLDPAGSDMSCVAVQVDGKLVIGASTGGVYTLLRCNTDGALDPTFSGDGRLSESFGLTAGVGISDVLVQGNGSIMVVGTVYQPGNLYDVALARYQGLMLPDIAVEQPMPTLLEDGYSTVAYGGPLPATVPVTKTFTIRNTGLAPLTGLAVTVDGTDAVDFQVTQPLNTPLAPGATRTFTVKLAPTSSGLKTAAIHVASNDLDEQPYDIALTANVASFPLAFERPSYAVEENDDVVIFVKRAAPGVGTTVNVTTQDGTAKATGTPADYNTSGGGTVTFMDANTLVPGVTVNAALDGTPDGLETLTVKLSGGTAPLGTPATATVRIIPSEWLSPSGDLLPPTAPTISTPAQGAVVTPGPNGEVTITGVAKDNLAVRNVTVVIEDASATAAITAPTVLADPGLATTNFSVTEIPVGEQPYTVKACTSDFASQTGPYTTVVRTFKVARPLPVTIQGTGTVTAGFAPQSYRETGKSFTITAIPGTGYLFDGWEASGTATELGLPTSFNSNPGRDLIGVTTASLKQAKLTFTMQAGLQLKAKFIPNPFIPIAGEFRGLVTSDDADPAPKTLESNSTEGFFTAKLEPTGAFSGKLFIDGDELKVTGAFDQNTGVAYFGTLKEPNVKVTRTGKPSLTFDLALDDFNDSDPTNDAMVGAVLQYNRATPSAVSDIRACRNYYSATNTVPAGYLATSPANGDQMYSVIFQARGTGNQDLIPGITTAEYPQSPGYASMKLTKAGAVTFTGRLSDDTPFTYSGVITRDGTNIVLPFFLSLYSKAGCITGPVELLNEGDPDLTYMDDTNRLLWFRPYVDAQHYQYGWPEGLKTNISGAKYVLPPLPATATSSVLPDLVAARTATATFTGGLLTGPTPTEQVKLSATDVASDFPAVDPIFSMTITRATGVISGNFLHSDGTTRPYYGIIYQKGAAPANRGAFGYFMSQSPAVKDYLGESGTWILKAD